MARFIVAITGASGVVYGCRLVSWLLEEQHQVNLVVSEAGLLVMGHEMQPALELSPAALPGMWPGCEERLTVYDNKDIGAVLASGSFKYDAMFIIPCSMATLSAVAAGLADNLIHRAADVALKEHRRLIIVPRETPLSAIHLENMLKLARLGVRMLPAMPAFYHRPEKLADLIDFVVGKALDAADLDHELVRPYDGAASCTQ